MKLLKTGTNILSGDTVIDAETLAQCLIGDTPCTVTDELAVTAGVTVKRSELACGGEEAAINGFYHYFDFAADDCEMYWQASQWCHENQGKWSDFCDITFSCKGYRTAETATPFLAVREKGDGSGYAFQLIPNGAWEIKTSVENGTIRILLGIKSKNLNYILRRGEKLSPPEVVFYPFDDVGLGAHKLHRWFNETNKKPLPPLIYNTWFLAFDRLEEKLLREQVRAAKELGLEIFTVDAGWFGEGLDWTNQVGCWEENRDIAFAGKMREFFDYVRSQGLGCGLWIEPSRAVYKTRIYKEHPEYFIREKDYALFDFSNPDAAQYMYTTICRLIDTYSLAMMKLDENGTTEDDPSEGAFIKHSAGYRTLLERLRAKYPNVYFEGCQSGGMSSELGKMRQFDWQFLSDTVNPDEALRIFSGALLRMPAFSMGKWLALESAGTRHRRYDDEEKDTVRLYSSADAKWSRTIEVDPDYAYNVAMTGPIGFSCDLAGLDKTYFEHLKRKIAFYKEYRLFLAECVCYALMPAACLDDRHTPAVFQYYHSGERRSLIFVFCQNDIFDVKFVPQEISGDKTYRITFTEESRTETISGKELLEQGIRCVFPAAYRSKLLLLEEV